MHFRIHTVLCWAVLVGLASAAQSNQRGNGGFTFKEDAEIEGSGDRGEFNHDLESSGSGGGPDDEDNEESPRFVPGVVGPTVAHVPIDKASEPELEGPRIYGKEPDTPSTTEDSSVVMNPKSENAPTSFFAQPGILAAVIGGAVVGLLCAILVVMFIVYRMRKKDEGSYALGEPKQSPNANTYSRGANSKEFFA